MGMIETGHRAPDPEQSQASVPLSEHEMGSLLSNLGQHAAALEAYEAAIQRNPADALAYIGQGNMLLFLNQPAEALAAYTKAARLAPTLALAYAGRGMALRT